MLIVGTDKTDLLPSSPFLLIHDGEFDVSIPHRTFDYQKHTFNPLKGMNYLNARTFLNVLNGVFPEGETTLTKRYSDYVVLQALLLKPKRLATLIEDTKETQDAYQKIQTLLLSPVLNRVLTNPTNFSFKGTIVAKLDRAELGDFDAYVLANLLISQYKGRVVLPDFGFYQCPFHRQLLRQGRLHVGINAFDEVPEWKSQLLLIDEKSGHHCTAEDAATLAEYSGLSPGTNAFNDFIEQAIR